MKKIGIFYGSSTGTTQSIAEAIASKLGIPTSDIIDVAKMTADKVNGYEVLLLGTSTWGDGEVQDDWYDGIKVLKSVDLKDKTIAFFGCGDSDSYGDTFCDGMGVIYEDIKDSGATFVGKVSASEYSFSSSISVIDGSFIGLALDDVNESDKTDERIDAWVDDIKNHLA